MSIIEKIQRRPVNAKFIEYTTTVFAVLLISFMLYVSWADVKRFSLFKAMFRKDVQIEQADEPGPTAPAK